MDVVQIPRGVAVVAETTWAAIKGRDALAVEWDEGAAERRGSEQILAEYRALLGQPEAAVARSDGDPQAALEAAGAERRLEAVFEFPYLAHAALEPMNAVALAARRPRRGLGRPPDAGPLPGGRAPGSPSCRSSRCGCT